MASFEQTNLKCKSHLDLTHDYNIVHKISPYTEICDIHNHDYFEIIINLNGNIKLYLEEIKYTLIPGDIIITPPGIMHRFIAEDKNTVYDRIVFSVKLDYIERLIQSQPKVSGFLNSMENNYGHLVRFEPSKLEKTLGIITKLEEAHKNSIIYENITSDYLISLLLTSLTKQLKKCGQTKQLNNDGIIPNVIKYINENLDNNLSLDSISEYFSVNKFHLLHEFKKYTNSTVYDYIITKRIIYAKRLIRDGYSTNDACKKCGVPDYSNFFKSFVKRTGITPNEYKKQCKNQSKK